MAVFTGLNVSRLFADISNTREALKELGIDIDDVNILNGELSSTGNSLADIPLSQEEVRTLSGLETDAKKELYALNRSFSSIDRLVSSMEDITVSLPYNMRIDDQFRAGAIKYNFYDFSTESIRTGDISTSRVSSWSGDSNEIFYGGEVEVTADPSSNNSVIDVSALNLNGEVQPLKFAGEPDTPETATHLITLKVNGVDRQFYAMKGIPVVYRGFFRNTNGENDNINISDNIGTSGQGGTGLFVEVIPSGNAEPRWIVRNVSDGREFISASNQNLFRITDSTAKERDVELYYNPDKILKVGVAALNISNISTVVMPELTYYNLNQNNLTEFPRFDIYTPKLRIAKLRGNNLSNARYANGDIITANTQLNTGMPPEIRHLDVAGCFVGSEDIDISASAPELRELNMSAFYDAYTRRSMTSTVSPKVGQRILSYDVTSHSFARLSRSILTAPHLRTLSIASNNMTGAENRNHPANTTAETISLATRELRTLRSRSNPHNVISAAGMVNLRTYEHTRSRNILGGDSNTIESVFDTNNVALQSVDFYGTDVAGNINTAFAGLPALRDIDIRYTRIQGRLQDDSFSGSNSLQTLRIAGGQFGANTEARTDFFSVTSGTGSVFSNASNLSTLAIYNNKEIGGPFPSFENNNNLISVFVADTNINGAVPLFSNNLNIENIILRSNALTGNVPSYESPTLLNVSLQSNNLDGDLSTTNLSCPKLRTFRVEYNQLIGVIPSFENCPDLRIINCQGNSLTGYIPGSLVGCRFIRTFDASENQLSGSAITSIITDLLANYNSRPRGSVVVNLSNNNFEENNNFLDESTLENINALRSFGWTIIT